jgi:hypothetical protein
MLIFNIFCLFEILIDGNVLKSLYFSGICVFLLSSLLVSCHTFSGHVFMDKHVQDCYVFMKVDLLSLYNDLWSHVISLVLKLIYFARILFIRFSMKMSVLIDTFRTFTFQVIIGIFISSFLCLLSLSLLNMPYDSILCPLIISQLYFFF